MRTDDAFGAGRFAIGMWHDPRRAGWLMWAYFLLSLIVGSVVYLSVGPASSGQPGHGYNWIFSAFFAWRVTRGGRISRMLLILGAGLGYLETAFTVARHFGPATFGVLAIYIVQLALLMSPSVYQRTRPRDWAEPPAATRVLPPLTLLLLGVFAGLSVTLLGLAGMGPGPAAPGCVASAAPPGLCDTLADGTPLRWVTLHDGLPSAHWAAMAKDWVQWSVVSTSMLYGLWLAKLARREPLRTTFPVAAAVGSALGALAPRPPCQQVTARAAAPPRR
ncbi:hypothetical protein EAS64_11150 [Trebonia kvetii]|uniref:Uncharacterized protein n=1 Tax=Trebonia kvetii TaxID=2480626 RepID=A0A6P2C164_9ACTN|nr:hypothetical protein [Trebonia kvetii]TVZ05149.1 hypothetical protein EAS64_11150 [Trebonia kvetii]